MSTSEPLTPLSLRIEAALLAASSKADGTAVEDLLLLVEDVLELVEDVEELEDVEDEAADLVGSTG
jgi:hypothetical protein